MKDESSQAARDARKAKYEEFKKRANEPKSRLIALLSEVETLSEKQAAGLSRAIATLERWQHSKN